MKHHDRFRVRGELRVLHVPGDYIRDGRPLAPYQVEALIESGAILAHRYTNTIVDLGLSGISRLLGYGLGFPSVGGNPVASVADLRVTSMRLGTTLSPPSPATNDIDISENPASYTINALTAYYTSATSVTFAGVLPQATTALDGFAFTEEGLFFANGAMLAHVTFSPEVKIPTHAIQFEHIITITRP